MPTPPPLTAALVRSAAAYAEHWLSFRRRYLRVPGVQAAVGFGDEEVLSTASGHADVESDVALTPDHLFRIASHSKTFTGTAVMQLAEAGALRLDDAVGTHVDWLEDACADLAPVTVRELLAHGGGVTRDGDDADHWQLDRPFPDEAGLRAVVERDGSVLPANTRFKYSNIGYALLGLVVESASGRSYNDYVRAKIVDRLDLTDTAPELDPARAGDLATGYSALSYADTRVPIDHVDTRAMSAATGFTSTARDLCRYLSAHVLGATRLLTDGSKRLMQRDEWEVKEGETWYGLGLSVSRTGDRRMVGHGGGYPGHATRSMVDPKAGLAVSVLTNAIDGPAAELATGVVKLIDLTADTDRDGDRDAVAPEVLDRFCGRFANLWGVLDIVRLGDRLYGLSPADADPAEEPTELAVEDADTLLIRESSGLRSPGERLTFEIDDRGVRAIRGRGGMTYYPYDEFSARMADRDRVRLAGG
ncbi:MAG: serine hydrolase [Streptosporangiales bacterium]|nr:serine hydrolase [Streptosporangiales bacterium]